jgi:hypothetical protein
MMTGRALNEKSCPGLKERRAPKRPHETNSAIG